MEERIINNSGLLELSQFIKEKASLINNKIQEKSKTIIGENGDKPNEYYKLNIIQAALTYEELNRLKAELDALKVIAGIFLKLLDTGTSHPEQIIISAFLQEEINKERVFNTSHPLYGFKSYHKILLKDFKERENYERCAQIQKVIESEETNIMY